MAHIKTTKGSISITDLKMDNSNSLDQDEVICYSEYKKWYLNKFVFHEDNSAASSYMSKIENCYESNVLKILNSDELIKLKTEINRLLAECEDKYYIKTSGYSLFTNKKQLDFVKKPFESVINKTFRKNIVLNKRFPNESESGWINHHNWFSKIKDLIRTDISVKYLDGVDFLICELRNLADSIGYSFCCDYEVKDVGYYAAHVYFKISTDTYDENFNVKQEDILIEIQISTQLQDVIKKLLHENYEQDRILSSVTAKPWQWEYKDDTFFVNYLGHTLHYLEGLILDLRNRQHK